MDAHGLVLKSFKILLEIAEGEPSRVLAKNAKTYEAWTSLITKVDIYICTFRPGPMYEKWEPTSNNHIVAFAIHFFGWWSWFSNFYF